MAEPDRPIMSRSSLGPVLAAAPGRAPGRGRDTRRRRARRGAPSPPGRRFSASTAIPRRSPSARARLGDERHPLSGGALRVAPSAGGRDGLSAGFRSPRPRGLLPPIGRGGARLYFPTGCAARHADGAAGAPTAAELLNRADEDALERIFADYGDERRARRLAREIVRRRERRAVRGERRPGERHPRDAGAARRARRSSPGCSRRSASRSTTSSTGLERGAAGISRCTGAGRQRWR